MTIQEENEQLRNKLAQYEEFLEKMVEGPFSSGTVMSKKARKLFRVEADGGDEQIISYHPDIDVKAIKEGTRVLFNKSMIVVKKTQSKRDGHWIFGHSNLMKKTVKVSINDDKGKPLDNETIQITALHELVHSIFTTGQYLDETRDEALVEWVARSIRALYKQGVIQQIMTEDTSSNENIQLTQKRINKYGEEIKQ